jgi:3-methylcrotonyl-CoA carboxylase alpha subunit
MFDSILIANRGEIACRVIETARRMGLRTVAVYSEPDAAARHVALADDAHLIGPASARDSYLKIENIVAAIKESGAAAVHPGYGFLSENAEFAEAGAIFVGPPAAAIRAMGSKSAAKALMAEAGVPIVPGYHGEDQDPDRLAREAEATGYPVLIKAVAGGGGRGMRAVMNPEDFAAALESARREAEGAFGDGRVLLERYVTRPRHIEVQVFADSHGNAVHLFERDCSIQRRHQKVIEEAPAPGMTPERRAAMGEAAVAAARAIGYEGAGTVEFLADPSGEFWFMEMNTRLQVEHPVTEMITAEDLVEWQLRVAAGEDLPLGQDELEILGHAIEVRLYAEDPARGFMPATGTLAHLRFPEESAHVRVDTGVREGDEVSVHYDPMIAKLIVWDESRDAALRRLRGALAETQVVGVTTNVDFLLAIAWHSAFAAGEVDTGFIDRHMAALSPERGAIPDRILAIAAIHVLLRQTEAAALAAAGSADSHSPWHDTGGWRLNDHGRQTLRFDAGEESAAVTIHYERVGGWRLDLPQGTVAARGERRADGGLILWLDGARIEAMAVDHAGSLNVMAGGQSHVLTLFDPIAAAEAMEAPAGSLKAPLPGKILQVLVAEGDSVRPGQALMILEAMKMEHTIAAPAAGKVATLRFAAGDQVEEGAELLVIEDAA